MKTDRLMGILTLLLQKKEVTAQQLAEKFEVSRRTINRDIDILCQAGIPVVTRQGYQGGISLAEGFTIDRTLLDRNDLETLLIGVKGLDSVMKEPHRESLAAKLRIGEGRPEEGPESIVINLASHYHDSLSDKIALLQRAVHERKLVRFTYHYPKGEGNRTVEPYCVLFQWSSWYLLAWCLERKDFRMFKLNRLWNPEALKEGYEPRCVPEELLDVDAPFSEEEWRLAAQFDPAVKYRLIEEYGPDCFRTENDGSLTIDGRIQGAVMGHFRYGPYDLHEIRIELPEDEVRQRREEIRAAVEEVNGEREVFPKIVCVCTGRGIITKVQ